jgi:hypothetical protein
MASHDFWRNTFVRLMLVCHKPGSAKVVRFMTIEDKTNVANLVV